MNYSYPQPQKAEPATEQDPAKPQEPQDPDYITVPEACAVIGGSKPISPPSVYRDPELKALIEHPTPRTSRIRRHRLLALLNARAARSDASDDASKGSARR
jgi:hypothetical protein